jgi:hypothetical protein
MVYTNAEGVKYPSSFVDKILALSHISVDRREEVYRHITKTEVERSAVHYLLRCPYWEEFISVCKIPRFNTINAGNVTRWRGKAREAYVRPSHSRLHDITHNLM